MQERIDFCIECIGQYLLKSQIKKAFRRKFDAGKPESDRTPHQTIELYLGRARELMRQRFEESQKTHAEKAIAFLQGVIRSTRSTPRDKLRAQEQLTDILGLAEAKKFTIVNVDGGKAQEGTTDARINQVFGIIRRATVPVQTQGGSIDPGTNGNGNGNGHAPVAETPVEDAEAKAAMG